jgi:hypothetical protein
MYHLYVLVSIVDEGKGMSKLTQLHSLILLMIQSCNTDNDISCAPLRPAFI